ncbi:nitrogen assimilation transcription factor nirA [Cordyceps javanica]|uniref:Nitrogen assimilation transcription factor nirA n=1 Tax=Cordyceps javanica TaxID=43265 RepID=A0A545VH53_9HYPO|nr:nitrogen assimilation transcription factor nirA [Cordyceps javanica]
MPRRPSPDRCQFCRRRKKKCDGQHPCYACSKAKIECVYAIPPPNATDATAQSAKQKSLKPKLPEPTTSTAALLKGDDTRGSVEVMPATAVSSSGFLSARDATCAGKDSGFNVEPNDPEQPIPSIEPSVSRRSFSASDAEDFSDTSSSPRPPPYTSPHVDWPQARVLRVLDNVLQWDCVTFCLIDRERFKLDFQTGSGTYCTPALVDALLALSVVVFRDNVVDQVANRGAEKPAWDIFSATLANEAIQTLHRGTWLPETVPDIQAIGVLALYCACHGWEDETRNFAMDFAEAIRKHCVQNVGVACAPTTARRAAASTYCGAISLNRLLVQIKEYRLNLSKDVQRMHDKLTDSSERSTCDSQSWRVHLLRPTLANEMLMADSDLRGEDIYLVVAELYQLIEQVFKTCCVSEKDRTFDDATATYIKGLEWYQNFFKHSETYTGREPLILFVHTYYHFCILSLFTPYVMDQTPIGHGGSPPGTICEEAAHIILKLMRHHDSLAGDTEPVGFMRLFKNASLEFLHIYKSNSMTTSSAEECSQ